MNKILYDKFQFDFKSIVVSWFDNEDIIPAGLSNLHFYKNYDLFERQNDQSTIWHKCFYKMIREDKSFNDVYLKFLEDKIKHYRNEEWADKVQELNYFVPLTKAYGTNTIWAETEEDLGDYKEIKSDYGECVEWSATKLTHGNKQNITSVTRVSFDFRVIPKSRYIQSNHLTINTKIPFDIGGYYEVL